jgi:putative ABC transport system permease protein
MLAVTFADLLFRARQFAIAVVGVGLVLALALALSGLADGFRAETSATVYGSGASSWVLSRSAHGSILAFGAFPGADVSEVARQPGVHRASPVLVAPGQAVLVTGAVGPQWVDLMGVQPGGLGDPAVVAGHRLEGSNQVVVDSKLLPSPHGMLYLGGHGYQVVGVIDGRTLTGGTPLVYMPLDSAQQAVTGGKPLVTAVATDGMPPRAPAGLVVLTPAAVVTDTVSEFGSAVSSIEGTRWLMWIVAAAIVAFMLYVAALDRRRDFAVLKALGASSASLFMSLAIEAVVVTLLAAVLAEVLASLLKPIFSQVVDITPDARLVLPLVAVAVGVVACLAALHRVTGADPAAAFG